MSPGRRDTRHVRPATRDRRPARGGRPARRQGDHGQRPAPASGPDGRIRALLRDAGAPPGRRARAADRRPGRGRDRTARLPRVDGHGHPAPARGPVRGAAGRDRARRAGHLHHRQPRRRPGLGRQGGGRGAGDDRSPAVPGRRPDPGRRPQDPGRARAPARPVQLLLRRAQPAGHPDGSPHRPGGHPADRVPRPRLGRRCARDGGPDRLPVLHRFPARLPQAGPPPVVADRDPAGDPDPGPDTRVRGVPVPVPGHRRLGAPGRDPRLRRARGPGGDRRAGGHPGPARVGLDQRAGPGQAGLRAEPGRPPAGRRPGRRRLPRVHLRAHPPPGARRLGRRLLRQLRVVHFGGGGHRREVRPAPGLRPQPADLLGRGDRGPG